MKDMLTRQSKKESRPVTGEYSRIEIGSGVVPTLSNDESDDDEVVIVFHDEENANDDSVTSTQERCSGWALLCLCMAVMTALGLLMLRNSAIFPPSNGKGNNSNGRIIDSTVRIFIDTDHILAHSAGTSNSENSGHGYGCVSVDFWPASKCDYGRCPWGGASSLTLPLTVPNSDPNGGSDSDINGDAAMHEMRLRKALQALSAKPAGPLILRLGGSTGCMSLERWDAINTLCSTTYSVNMDEKEGRRTKLPCDPPSTTCWITEVGHDDMPECCVAFEGEWDSSNAQALMHYTHDKGYQVWGFEYGNEMAGFGGVQIRLDPDMYVRGMCEMKRLIDNIWSDVEPEQRPRIIAPDSAMDPEWFRSMLKKSQDSGCLPHVVTWHQYLLGAGVDPDVGDRCMNPTVLDRQLEEAGISQSVVHDEENARAMDRMPELWMGETGGAYNSGRHMVTDAFHGSFWYLDRSNLLRIYTDTGHQAFCRQTLIGGNYGLVNTTTFIPNPDYYALMLFQRLMGERVLHTTVHGGKGYLRAYVHCSRKDATDGTITLLLINLSNKVMFHIAANDDESLEDGDLELSPSNNWLEQYDRTEWVMSSTSLDSQQVILNGGSFLEPSPTGDIPSLPGLFVHASSSGNSNKLLLHPHTYAFIRFENANVGICNDRP
eukprot:scaffold228404_cov55-Attheya_sp.AAC.1